jgi:3-phosphoshikimate 1-carboxyvinyltransferase
MVRPRGVFVTGMRSCIPVPIPDLIEIIPPEGRVRAQVTIPGSKSITNRALILAALAQGETILEGALWSEDTEAMVECLRELGLMINVERDPKEACNRTITVYGRGGGAPRGGTEQQPLSLFAANSGTTARFLTAYLCLGSGVYHLDGAPRMRQRPQAPLFRALRGLGYRIVSPTDKLPALIFGGGPRPGAAEVSLQESSQFASALLLCAERGGWRIGATGEETGEAPYVRMTVEMNRVFPHAGGRFKIEPDASTCSYFWAADWLLSAQEPAVPAESSSKSVEGASAVTVLHPPTSDWQIDSMFPRFLPLPATLSRKRDLGDSVMTAIVLAPFASHPVRFTDLGRLRLQESERVKALGAELTRCGAKVVEEGNQLTVEPSPLHGAEIATYDDHRLAMCFALVGLRIAGIRLKHPSCVRKTFPSFFQKLAAPPPRGLGVRIIDPASGQVLTAEELWT